MRTHLRDKLSLRFHLLDTDGDGYIGQPEYVAIPARVVEVVGVDPSSEVARRSEGAYAAEWYALIGGVDLDGDGRIDLEEFVTWVGRRLTEYAGAVHTSAAALFDVVDTDRNGFLDEREYVSLVECFGVSVDDAVRGFHRIDTDGDGLLSREEYASGVTDFYTSEDPAAPGNWIFGRIEGM